MLSTGRSPGSTSCCCRPTSRTCCKQPTAAPHRAVFAQLAVMQLLPDCASSQRTPTQPTPTARPATCARQACMQAAPTFASAGRLAAQVAYRPQDLCPARTLLTNDVCLRHVCTACCCDPVCRWVREHPATSGARCCWSCWCRWLPSPASTHCAQCSAWATPLVSAGHSLAGSHMCVWRHVLHYVK